MDKPASSAQAQAPAAPGPDARMDIVLRLACYSVIGLFGLGLLTVLKIASRTSWFRSSPRSSSERSCRVSATS